MSESKGTLGSVVAFAVVAVCCALPALVVTGAGFAGAIAGIAVRYWPLTLLGVAVFSWGVVRLGRLAWARRRSTEDRRRDVSKDT